MMQVFFATAVVLLSLSAYGKSFNPIAEKAYLEFCAGRDPAVLKVSDQLPELQARSIRLLTREGIATEKNRFSRSNEAPGSLSESDRIVFAMLMMLSRSNDIQKIRNLLDFKSENRDSESYRLATQSQLNLIEGDRVKAKANSLDALETAEFFEPGMFVTAISLVSGDPTFREIESKYESMLNRLPDSPSKSTVLGHMELAKNGWKNVGAVEDFFTKAYISCPRDPGVALDYATLLLMKNELQGARSVLEKVVAYYENSYTPYIDLTLGEIELRAGNYHQALSWIKRLDGSSAYLDNESRTRVSNLILEIQEHGNVSPDSKKWIYFSSIILVVTVFSALLAKRRFRS